MLKSQNEEKGICCYIAADIGKQGPPTGHFITPPVSKKLATIIEEATNETLPVESPCGAIL